MSVRSSEQAAPALFEFKSGSINLPILKLLSDDLDALVLSLRQKVTQAPDFFRNTPVVVDLHDVAGPDVQFDFSKLVHALHECGMVPVGVRGGSESQNHTARIAALAILADTRQEPAHHQAPPPRPATSPTSPVEPAIGKLIDHPVRSGQRIYAPGDLIVLSPVSAGAEIMADGNIHVYNTLRGRALAGVQGNLHSRIFCLDLQAELISIGGHYKVSENLEDSVGGKPIQIYLRDNTLVIEDL